MSITIKVVDTIFDLLGALSFCALLGAKAILLTKILWFRNCTGVSGKTQILYTLVFAARYLDLASSYYTSPVNVTLTKLSLLLMTYSIVLSIYFFYYESYESKHDKFRLELLILPSLVLALLANYGIEISDVFWAFSVYLEAMAIIPQLYFCSKAKKIDNSVYYYVLLLTLYKSFHIMNEMYNHFYMSTHFDRISLAAGVIQLMFYCDFFTREESDDDDNVRKDVETGNGQQRPQQQQQPDIFVHPKEAEAMRSAAQQFDYARLNENLSEVVLTPSMLTDSQDKACALPTPATNNEQQQEEDKKTNVNMPTA